MTQPFVVKFDAVAFHLGPIQVHWYGLMYLAGFFFVAVLGEYRRRKGRLPVTRDALGDLFFYGMMGVIVGGRDRLHAVLYRYPLDLAGAADPVQGVGRRHELSRWTAWRGGRDVVVVSRRHRLNLFDTVDFVAPLVPIGLGLGRLGNFINGELWGKPTSLPWHDLPQCARGRRGLCGQSSRLAGTTAAVRRIGTAPVAALRDALLEGLVLFLVIWLVSMKPRPRYLVAGLVCTAVRLFPLRGGVRSACPIRSSAISPSAGSPWVRSVAAIDCGWADLAGHVASGADASLAEV